MKITLEPESAKITKGSNAKVNLSLSEIINSKQTKKQQRIPYKKPFGWYPGQQQQQQKKKQNQQHQQQVSNNMKQQQKTQQIFTRQQQQQQRPQNIYTQQGQRQMFSQQQGQRLFQQKWTNRNPRQQNFQIIPRPGKLTITNLHPGVSEADIRTLFVEFGELEETTIHYDNKGNPIGSAHVIFKRHSDALKGQKRYNGVTLDGKAMLINVKGVPVNRTAGQANTPDATPSQQVTNQAANNQASNNQAANNQAANNQAANNQAGTVGIKTLKRLQKGPQPVQKAPQQMQKAPQQMQKAPQQMQKAPQQMQRAPQQMQRAPQQTQKGPQQTQRGPQQMQKGPKQPLVQKAPQQQKPLIQNVPKPAINRQGGGILPNPPGMNWGSNVPMSFGVSNKFNMGFGNQNYGPNMQGTGRFGGAVGQPSILGRLGGTVNTGGSLTGLDRPMMPSILDRLDTGVRSGSSWLNTPIMPNTPSVLSRVGNMMLSSGGVQSRVGGRGGSILNRVGDRSGNVQSGMAGNRQWSFAIPGGKPVNPQNMPKNQQQYQQGNQQKKKGNQQAQQQQQQQQNKVNQQAQQQQGNQQKRKGNQQMQQQQQQQGKKKGKKAVPTAEELDAELDAYLREMNTSK